MPAFSEQSPAIAGPILGIDTGSPTVSVAVVAEGHVLATRNAPQQAAGELLLGLIDESLREAGLGLQEIAGLAVLRGPGSFTGLRIGLATILGLHQTTGLPTAAIGTLAALAAAGADAAALATNRTIISAVDALRGEWTVQRFTVDGLPRSEGPARLVPRSKLEATEEPIVGHGLGRDATIKGSIEPPLLAAWAARLAARDPKSWDAAQLVEPLYARPPAVTPPRTGGP